MANKITFDGNNGTQDMRCAFCGRPEDEVNQLIGNNDVLICDECIKECVDVLGFKPWNNADLMNLDEYLSGLEGIEGLDEFEQKMESEEEILDILEDLPKPDRIYKELSKYVIDQENAKKALSVAVYNHYKRIDSTIEKNIAEEISGGAAQDDDSALDEDVEIAKSNILMLGPTGCGKTLLAQTLARILNVPFTIADATTLTEAGYVGEDVENILLKLITAADFDIEKAQIGIIYVDEIDKIARKAENLSITRDVSGEGVQQALLKIIEGTEASVPPQGGRKHPHQELLHIDTTNILFILGGAFVGLDKIVADRIGSGGIGFMSDERGKTVEASSDLLSKVLPEDLHKFGMIPEFVGRIPVISNVEPLDEDALVRILTEPKNALVKQYQKLLAYDNVKLTFTDEAVREIAHIAITRKVGARGLRSICEEALQKVMFEIPSRNDVVEVILTDAAVRGDEEPKLVLKKDLDKHLAKVEK